MVLLGRYAAALKDAWLARRVLAIPERTALERQFLPATLELIETPAPAMARAIIWTIIAAVSCALIWSCFGEIDVVAVAPGKVIAADKTKVVQPAETGIVKRILVTDGQRVAAGQVLVELDAAATATEAETEKAVEALTRARLEAARYDALARSARTLTPPSLIALAGEATSVVRAELRLMRAQYQEYRVKVAAVDAEIAKREAELASVERLVAKLAMTVPIAQRRAEDYKNLVAQRFVSEHGYLEREQERLEQEGNLAFEQAKSKELTAAVSEARKRRESLIAESERAYLDAKLDADRRAALFEQELVKARARQRQQTLLSPVDGTVQQLAIHTVGGVVTPAQVLMAIAPTAYEPEIEAVLDNRDVGFVKIGQPAEIKIETFPFTRYGTLSGAVSFVSKDAIQDEKRGLVFQVRVKLDSSRMRIDERDITMNPGMAVIAEISTGKRRVIEFFLDPIRRTLHEGLAER